MFRLLIYSLTIYYVRSSSKEFDYDELPKKKVSHAHENVIPVPFGHIFKDGIDDLSVGYKVPLDLLELAMIDPGTKEEEEKLLKILPKNRVLRIDKSKGNSYSIPIKTHLDSPIVKKNGTASSRPDEPGWFDMERLLEKNINTPRPKLMPKPNIRSTTNNAPDMSYIHKFSKFSFDFWPDLRDDEYNWTKCEEFAKGLSAKNVFHPDDVVGIEWEPFYIWSFRKHMISIIHKFQYPTKKVVNEYKTKYGPYLNKSLDWNQPKLLLKESREMLLIAGDRTGLFYGISKHTLPFSIKNKNFFLPHITMRLKIADPYLAIMYCDDFYATIMAPPGTEPKTDKEKIEEAGLLKFRGEGYPTSRDRELERIWQEESAETKNDNKFMKEPLHENEDVFKK